MPFVESFSGDTLFVDHRPGAHYGKNGGTNFGAPPYRLMWPSQEAMLDDVCVNEGRMLQWV
ncbi:hypothetical protein [Actinacidiphila acididurans]|uniref:Uncharacterized protein n=1 Tax=Actinacidiphila acididurans TaxID=2784346 RepID=A0ABS2TXH5_9ACTN|nr:hypothetical protein [Actinacidiphila acididurans]MBM9508045.1 hypothetical protein [Actinacidiphila acididurans]